MAVNDGGIPPILAQKQYTQPSAFTPENLPREARRQKRIAGSSIPDICVLDPDGDILRSLLARGEARLESGWACYHTQLYSFRRGGIDFGIVGCAVGVVRGADRRGNVRVRLQTADERYVLWTDLADTPAPLISSSSNARCATKAPAITTSRHPTIRMLMPDWSRHSTAHSADFPCRSSRARPGQPTPRSVKPSRRSTQWSRGT